MLSTKARRMRRTGKFFSDCTITVAIVVGGRRFRPFNCSWRFTQRLPSLLNWPCRSMRTLSLDRPSRRDTALSFPLKEDRLYFAIRLSAGFLRSRLFLTSTCLPLQASSLLRLTPDVLVLNQKKIDKFRFWDNNIDLLLKQMQIGNRTKSVYTWRLIIESIRFFILFKLLIYLRWAWHTSQITTRQTLMAMTEKPNGKRILLLVLCYFVTWHGKRT